LLTVAALCLAAPVRAEPVEISILTYNIHGLPSYIALDDPPARIPRILELAKEYDVVLLQEDFSHQPIVDASKRHPELWRGNGESLPWIGVGAGVTTLSRLASAEAPFAEPYGVCNGWLGAANDCLGNKGFLLKRFQLAGDQQLDVWNTHLDAGRSEADREARRAQLEKLAAAMEARSRGRAVLVGGDFNLEWTDPGDRAVLDAFVARVGLAIAAQTPPGGWETHLDYLLVRNGERVCIEPSEGGKDEAFAADGVPLSDHPAIRTRLRVGGC
jgi:endonuclease/exonuclease/phosphatase family metal-dependent hydrolase